MPKLNCLNCNGTGDASYDLPSNEYVYIKCDSCFGSGLKDACKSCKGKGEYVEGGENYACLVSCTTCGGRGYYPDSIEIEEECRCVSREPQLKKEKEESNFMLLDYFDRLLLEKGECLFCNGTKKVKRTYLEGTKEYENSKGRL